MSIIDISHLDVHDVILALWRNMAPLTLFQDRPDLEYLANTEPTIEAIDEALNYQCSYPPGYIHTLGCRFIETNFNDLKRVDTSNYNMRTGSNSFENIIKDLSSDPDIKEPE